MYEIVLTQRVHTGQYEHLDITVREYSQEGVDVQKAFDTLNTCLKRVDGSTPNKQKQ